MDFITGWFKSMFSSRSRQYKERAKAKVRSNTVGKVQGKMMKAQGKLDRKVNKAQDGLIPGGKKKKGVAGGGAGGGGGGGGGRAPVGPPGRAPAGPVPVAAGGGGGPGRAPVGPPVGPTAGQPRGPANMGKGKRNKGQMPMGGAVACGNCGSGLQPDWDMCPYCGAAAGQAMMQSYAPQQPQMGYPQPVAQPEPDSENKTVAINIADLKKGERPPVVGWIVAQNGNHRGEDFRLHDGKNVIGTAADCDIVITDPYLSAKHCTIRHEEGNFVLIDLDSTNGVYVNQKRVSKMDLIDNDTIRFGRTEFKFKSLF